MLLSRTPVLAAAALCASLAAAPCFAADGVPDPDFGVGGAAFITPDDVEARELQPYAATVLPDGKLLFGGQRSKYNPAVPFEPEFRAMFAQMNPDGSVDTDFGNTSSPGVVVLPALVPGARMEGIESMQRLDDGSIVAVGVSQVNTPLRGFVVKVDATGAIDTSFGGGAGFVLIDSTYLHAVAIDSQGRIVASGEHIENPVYTSTVIRLNADGTFDDTFGTGGTATIDWDGAGESGYLTSMTLMADDRIVVGGFYEVYGSGLGSDFALARLATDGTPDTEFAGTGWRVFHDPSENSWINGVNRLALTPDGGVAFAGYHMSGENITGLIIGHVDATGNTDEAFGDASSPGFFKPAILPTAQSAYASSLLVQGDGKLVVSVTYYAPFPDKQDFFALRTTATGQLDTSFADSGIFDFDLAPAGVYSDLSTMTFQPDGNLILAGRSMQSTEESIVDLGVMRLLNGGEPDDRIFASGFDP
jgi:uncharacterized delta-60 repeat protein